MEAQLIISLLEQKFAGVRKDGLAVLAQSIGLTCNTEEDAKKYIESLTEDKVKSFVTTYRQGVDKEITTATETREKSLREKYDFTEKGKPQQPTPPKTTSPEDIAAQIAEAIAKANAPLMQEIQGLKSEKVSATRKEQLLSAFTEQVPESIKTAMLHDFDSMSFADDMAFAAYLEQKKTDIAALTKEFAEAGLSVHQAPNFGKTDKDGVSDAVKSFIEASSKGSENAIGKEMTTK